MTPCKYFLLNSSSNSTFRSVCSDRLQDQTPQQRTVFTYPFHHAKLQILLTDYQINKLWSKNWLCIHWVHVLSWEMFLSFIFRENRISKSQICKKMPSGNSFVLTVLLLKHKNIQTHVTFFRCSLKNVSAYSDETSSFYDLIRPTS